MAAGLASPPMEAAGIADWSEMAQELRHAWARVNGYVGFANGRWGLAFGSRQQPSEEDEQREDDAPWPATGGKDRGREGTAQEGARRGKVSVLGRLGPLEQFWVGEGVRDRSSNGCIIKKKNSQMLLCHSLGFHPETLPFLESQEKSVQG